MGTPLLLDLFAGAGGASMGYHRAGFEVLGVDSEKQPHYPFKWYQEDAIQVLVTLLSGSAWHSHHLSDFSALHASPVCKAYTELNFSPREKHPMQIAAVRELLQATGKPFVIENVKGARKHLHASLMLCATMFGLPMERHRLFESNVCLFAPGPCNHAIAHIHVYGNSIWDSWLEGTARKDGRKRPDSVSVQIGRDAMGIQWMNKKEMAQALPPAFTEWIGTQLLSHLREEVCA